MGKLWGRKGVLKNSVLSAQFFHKTKTALKTALKSLFF